ncbi:sarcosine oxidase subunit gamma family protein [Mesorhizobium microcysteis]|uniref:Sarcosine oxidase subunit gamma family protein n=1 Tax=Neoaquamicrobium microcysteis TaxID=2682781 RepID=A0A5D4GWZ9_9HYPH|nr:sarcosine oxidase subunit gamma family protein [Mesorhizobium microcysteis]TYR32918.1 sarcosine oxidase subunit gamma family protein [Mesorhizobium microcysteis]
MVEQMSPLGDAYVPGSHGNFADGTGVKISLPQPGSIVEATAWPGREAALAGAIERVTGLSLPHHPGGGVVTGDRSGFGIGPRKWLLTDAAEGLAETLRDALGIENGTVTDLSHGRTAIRLEGERAEWVLAKFFALDFSSDAFPVGSGRATMHHDILAQIQRTGPSRFNLYVFRTFARSFWRVLCHGAEEVGYEVR